MKHLIFAFVLVIVLIPYTFVSAQQQAILRSYESIRCGGPGDNDARMERCKEFCKGDPLHDFIKAGYRVISTRAITIKQYPFKTNSVRFSDDGFCECIGAEYVLAR